MQLTSAPSANLSPIICVLSNISRPGPEAKHSPPFSGHLEVFKSQVWPLIEHLGPIIFGETSPKFDEQKAPTNFPYNTFIFISDKNWYNFISIYMKTYSSWNAIGVELLFQEKSSITQIVAGHQSIGVVHGCGVNSKPVKGAQSIANRVNETQLEQCFIHIVLVLRSLLNRIL